MMSLLKRSLSRAGLPLLKPRDCYECEKAKCPNHTSESTDERFVLFVVQVPSGMWYCDIVSDTDYYHEVFETRKKIHITKRPRGNYNEHESRVMQVVNKVLEAKEYDHRLEFFPFHRFIDTKYCNTCVIIIHPSPSELTI